MDDDEDDSIESAIRKTIALNLRYYVSLGRLNADYWKELLTGTADEIEHGFRTTRPIYLRLCR